MRCFITFLMLFSFSLGATAVPIAAPPLSANIRDDNGAFNNVFWNEEFFRLGFFVSNYGFQLGNNAATFALLDANGSNAGLVGSVTGLGNTVTALGNYVGAVDFTRTYTIPSGYSNVITVTTELVNIVGSPVELYVFDTFDPDQGPGVSTTNDVISNPGGVVGSRGGIATNGRTVLWATQDPAAVLGFGGGSSPFGLGINSGTELNTFLASPFDPNNANADIGFAIAFHSVLAPFATDSFSYDMVFGNTVAEAGTTYARLRGGSVPEPATLALFSLGLAGLGFARRRSSV